MSAGSEGAASRSFPPIGRVRWLVPALGVVLPVVLEYVRTGRVVPAGMLPLLLYLASPYFLLWIVSFLVRDPRTVLASLLALVAVQLWAWFGVVTGRRGAPLLVLKLPFYQMALVLPAGLAAGHAWRRHAAGARVTRRSDPDPGASPPPAP